MKGLFPELWMPPATPPRSWGMKYRGSKNKHAKEIFEAIENHLGESLVGKHFVDAFMGGAAMSHYAIVMRGMAVLTSDIIASQVDLLNAVIFDGYSETDEFWEWVSKEDFHSTQKLSYLKEATFTSVWTFNGLENRYLYSKEKEKVAREVYDMIIWEKEPNYKILPIGREHYERIVAQPGSKAEGFKPRRLEWTKVIKELLEAERSLVAPPAVSDSLKDFSELFIQPRYSTKSITAAERIGYLNKVANPRIYSLGNKERLEPLTSLSKIEIKHQDYKKTLSEASKDSIIYLDPPYENTLGYTGNSKAELKASGSFNYHDFWGMAKELSTSGYKVFVSSYEARPGWTAIWEKSVNAMSSGGGNYKKKVEKLFVYTGG